MKYTPEQMGAAHQAALQAALNRKPEDAELATVPYYRGPYVLMRDKSGKVAFIPAARDDQGYWQPATPEQIATQTR